MDYAGPNFFFRDFVSEDVMSMSIGKVWLYFYKETLIGVRDCEKEVAYFATLESVPKENSPYLPTIEMMKEEDVMDAIDEVTRDNEKTHRVPIDEVLSHAKELVAASIAADIDKRLVGA